jgi:hypothetical protein
MGAGRLHGFAGRTNVLSLGWTARMPLGACSGGCRADVDYQKPRHGHFAALQLDLGEFVLSGDTNSPRSRTGAAKCPLNGFSALPHDTFAHGSAREVVEVKL